jgi:uridylate kinase
METVVVSIGGSILVPGNDDAGYIERLAEVIRKLCEGRRLFLICGGGKVARQYISLGRELGGSSDELDMLGIDVTRVNARLLAIALGDRAVQEVPRTPDEALRLSREGRVVVMGGTVPGHTTDAVAAMVARVVKADRIVNATSVDAAYSADPRTDPKAVRYSHLGFEEFHEIVKGDHEAGNSSVFDSLGAFIAMKEGIAIYIVNGRELEELSNAITGREIEGTVIS